MHIDLLVVLAGVPAPNMETVDLKLVLLGQPGVGKTCLVYRYLYNTFGETISVREAHSARTSKLCRTSTLTAPSFPLRRRLAHRLR